MLKDILQSWKDTWIYWIYWIYCAGQINGDWTGNYVECAIQQPREYGIYRLQQSFLKLCSKVTSQSAIPMGRPNVMSISDVQKQKFKINVQKWRPKVTLKSDVQKWCLKVMSQSNIQKWRLKMISKNTSKSDIQIWRPKVTYTYDVQKWCPRVM